MRQITTVLFGALALSVAGVSGASAADMPVKAPGYAPSHSWTGLYIGVNAGYASSNAPTSGVPCTSSSFFSSTPGSPEMAPPMKLIR